MSEARERILRVIVGPFFGFLWGIVVGFGLLILLAFVCIVDGAKLDDRPKHEWVRITTQVAALVITMVAPVTGCLIGVIWALRRNRRDETKNHGRSP